MQILCILFGGHHKTRLFFGFIFMHLQVFFKFNVQNGIFFVGCLFVVVVVFSFFCGGGGGGGVGGKQ